jgi:hypothetical protein
VTVRYRHQSFLEWLTNWREPHAQLTLNGSIPWEIEFRGGVSKLTADLRALSLRALDLGSASEIKLMLPSLLALSIFISPGAQVTSPSSARPAACSAPRSAVAQQLDV